SVSTPFTLLTSLVYLSVIAFNRFGFTSIGRILLCTFLPIITLYITILLKKTGTHTDILYYDSRVILLASGLVPCLVFHTRERFKLYGLLCFTLLCLVLFDPIHEFIGQGYYQKGFTGPSYYYINHISVVAFLAISASAMMLKIISERAEEHNMKLIADEERINESLQKTNSELKLANAIIQNQRNELTEHNRQLEQMVQEKGQKLVDANEELIKHNHELQQFSYTISHNLRAPVARLLGLTNLLSMPHHEVSDEMRELVRLIKESALEFDGVIRDLNKIIDVRNEFYRVKEKIHFKHELEQAKKSVGENLFADVRLHTDFLEPVIYTVRPILSSILYNLISNAIKYKSTQRPLELSLKTYQRDNFVVLEVCDNGMGMNLESYGKELFGLYKRFHAHIEGRGLGLYLVKSQVESLGGRIEIKSQLNTGTTFFIYFKILTDIDGQICLDNDACTVFYNARINALGVVWKCQPTSEQYRQVFIKCLEMMMLYPTPYWISDLRKQSTVSVDDQKWMFKEIFPAAVQHGLRTGICIYDPQQHNEDYRERLKNTSLSLGIETFFFQSQHSAEEWIESRAERKNQSA
ncbi:MAG TPA: HAMP domain-containing sensor histidine kinase, partial [Cyclobacteriaceae bacterium]|nr:HAMP domain-containing sensor histidine kinase [Cyclobacteriaceae bacterium]